MKIHAVRGENLTSLAGSFEVDFDAAPLRDAGLFAITGPVGAGKTTLLDALCLALFDRTPRLAERGGALIGVSDDPARLQAHDVRGLLRRGAGSGFAEVDFRGRSGRRLRARWSVRRARGRVDGRFQNQEMSLTVCETGEPLGGSKSETLAAIEGELGLTFEQFRRSVVLAQNEFAAFLQAKSKDRAGLLERMTDTAIYGELSIAAHRRAAEAREQIARLESRLAEVQVLDPEARGGLESNLAEAMRLVETLTRAVRSVERRDGVAMSIAQCDRRLLELDSQAASKTEAERAARVAVADVRREIEEHDRWSESLRPQIRDARVQDQRISELHARFVDRERALLAEEAVLDDVRRAVQLRRPASELPPGYDDVARELARLLDLGARLREAQSRLENATDACARAERALAVAEESERARRAAFEDASQATDGLAGGARRLAELASRREELDRERERIAELQAQAVRDAALAETLADLREHLVDRRLPLRKSARDRP